jgi:VPS62-like protein
VEAGAVSARDDATLLERHRPVLRYDSQGSFFADSAATLTDFTGRPGSSSSPGNCLRRGRTVLADAVPGAGPARLDLSFLGGTSYADGRAVERSDVVDARGGDHVLDARHLHADPRYANVAYGHLALDGDGGRWLQYWLFYYYNDKAFLGIGLHEGDWEMVQVGVDAAGRPQRCTFAQHKHAQRCDWEEVERVAGGDRPVVYVARGSQASYPWAGSHPAPVVPDEADGRGARVDPRLEVIDDGSPGWVDWPGRWGSTRARNVLESDSPRGPRQKASWRDPLAFHEAARERRRVRGAVPGEPALLSPPRPEISARREDGHAVISYRFPEPTSGTPAPVRVVLSVDSPDDDLPPATYSYAVEDLAGEERHPLPLEDRSYVARASAASAEGVTSDTVEVAVEEG